MLAQNIGTPDRPLRVAIVGSGPAGFYAAEAVLSRGDASVHVDMFERLPTPYGLVRGGVAPDHQKVKSVVSVYERSASRTNFRFFGNVMLGRDITAEELVAHYDQIVYAVGNEADRRMGIPGEDLEGVTPATVFVGWYNGHPDYRGARFNLGAERVAVIGNGNVAVDVARILGRTPEELAKTDIAEHALGALRGSRVREILMLGRRGPVQAAFTPAELRELGHLDTADAVVEPAEIDLDELSRDELERSSQNSRQQKNITLLRSFAEMGEGTKPRKIRFRFLVSPVEILGDGGKVRSLRVERNELQRTGEGGLRARGTGAYQEIEAGLVLVSIGYEGVPIPGVPFDPRRGVISNTDGRVTHAETGEVVPGQYVVGWARSGPQGLIGSHKAASGAVVKLMFEDVASGRIPARDVGGLGAVEQLLRGRGIGYVSFVDWKVLDQVEVRRGERRGAPRVKLTDVEDMLAVMRRRPGSDPQP